MKVNIHYHQQSFKSLNPAYRFLSKSLAFKEVDGKQIIVLH